MALPPVKFPMVNWLTPGDKGEPAMKYVERYVPNRECVGMRKNRQTEKE